MNTSHESPADEEPVICRACGKPIEPFSEIYSIGPEHWACHKKSEQEYEAAEQRMGSLLREFSPRKRAYVPVGKGGPTRKLAALVLECAQKKFPGAQITDVNIYPVSPYWRRVTLDVQRIEGNITIDGYKHLLGSWHNVSELLRYRNLVWTYESPGWHLSPDLTSRRSRRNKT